MVVALLAAGVLLTGADRAAAAPGQTVVSLGFDDGYASQYAARSMLASHGMHGTFFVMSAALGQPGYMTQSQVADLAADGNEIGGHTLNHLDLAATDPAEVRRQICDDRTQLLADGFQVADFAYPYGTYNAQAEQIAQDCGYNSARTTGWYGATCPAPCTESIPPHDAFATTVVGFSDQTLPELETAVTSAEAVGGWAQIVIHEVCDGCAISAATLNAFLDWLAPRAAGGTVVRTVRQVIGGPVHPAVPGPAPPAAPNGTNAVSNAGLEQDTDGDGVPDCFLLGSYGGLTATWTRTAGAHSGSYAERVDVSGYSSGDAKLIEVADAGACTPSVTPGHRYTVGTWYRSTVPVRFNAFTRNSRFAYAYWAASPTFPASPGWSLATWTTPAVPTGINGLQAGLTISANGSLTVDDLAFDDAAPTDTTPPQTSITDGPSGAISDASPSFAFASSEPAGATFECRLDGPGAATGSWGACTSPKAYASLADGSYSMKVRASDAAQNTDPTPAARSFTLDTTAPPPPLISLPAENAWNATGSVVLSGSAEPNSTVEVFDGAVSEGSTSADGSGTWSTTLSGVPDGSRIYTATAADALGNTSAASAPLTVRVDTVAPETLITAGPSGTTAQAAAAIAFAGAPDATSFECAVDGAPFGPCSPPLALTALAPGLHTVAVRASDAAGNVDATPASRTWSVDPSWDGPVTTTGQLIAGGTISSTASGAEGAAVTTPVAGPVSITTSATSALSPSGYSFLGGQVQITAPQATPGDPLVLTFRLDGSLLPAGVAPADVAVFRNGVLVPGCTGAGAVPDPCVVSRALGGGGLVLVVRTSEASLWTLGRLTSQTTPTADVPPPSAAPGPPALASQAQPPGVMPAPKRCKVPALRGRTLASARSALTRAHCRLGTISRSRHHRGRAGIVLTQGSRAGRSLPADARIDLTISRR